MRIKVLMIGDNEVFISPDVRMLKDRRFSVYTCMDFNLAAELAKEVKPDVIFVNVENPNLHSTNLYHELLDDMELINVPVIYTLFEDDVYLVNRKRTAYKGKRNIIADNIIDAIKLGMLSLNTFKTHKEVSFTQKSYPLISQIVRA